MRKIFIAHIAAKTSARNSSRSCRCHAGGLHRDTYLNLLDPAKFNAAQMTFWCVHREEQQDDERLKALQSQHFEDKAQQQLVFTYITQMN
jgi:hypothetical protein